MTFLFSLLYASIIVGAWLLVGGIVVFLGQQFLDADELSWWELLKWSRGGPLLLILLIFFGIFSAWEWFSQNSPFQKTYDAVILKLKNTKIPKWRR